MNFQNNVLSEILAGVKLKSVLHRKKNTDDVDTKEKKSNDFASILSNAVNARREFLDNSDSE